MISTPYMDWGVLHNIGSTRCFSYRRESLPFQVLEARALPQTFDVGRDVFQMRTNLDPEIFKHDDPRGVSHIREAEVPHQVRAALQMLFKSLQMLQDTRAKTGQVFFSEGPPAFLVDEDHLGGASEIIIRIVFPHADLRPAHRVRSEKG